MQCPSGGFRSAYPNRPTDPCNPDGHVDATAMAVQALLTVRGQPGVDAAITRAVTWLERSQRANGAFDDDNDDSTIPSNTNSTGLAGQALRAVGRTGPAAEARGWVESRQIGCEGAVAVRGAVNHTSTQPVLGDEGPRATFQAVLAFDAPAYGAVGGGAATEARPLDCSDGSTPTIPPTQPTMPPTAPPTAPPTQPAGETVPEVLPPGGSGIGTGGSGGSGSGAHGPGRGRGPFLAGGPNASTTLPPDQDEPLPGSLLQAVDGDAGDRPESSRPFSQTDADESGPTVPLAVAAGVGAVVLCVSILRLRHTAPGATAPSPPSPPTTAPRTDGQRRRGPPDDGSMTRTEDLPSYVLE
jgi:hypothetical protein